jgi:hypothetical protein
MGGAFVHRQYTAQPEPGRLGTPREALGPPAQAPGRSPITIPIPLGNHACGLDLQRV